MFTEEWDSIDWEVSFLAVYDCELLCNFTFVGFCYAISVALVSLMYVLLVMELEKSSREDIGTGKSNSIWNSCRIPVLRV